MRKCILLTNETNTQAMKRYNGHRFFALPNVGDIIYSLECSYTILENTQLKCEKEEDYLSSALQYLYERGYDEIIVLMPISNSAISFLFAQRIFEKYNNISIAFESEKESIRHYPLGTYILTKDNCQNFSLFGFLKATITLDYATSQVSHYVLDVKHDPILHIEFLSRIVVLHVEKGSVLLVKKWGEA